MRVVEAARLVSAGLIAPELLWQMTTTPERVVISLLLGRQTNYRLTPPRPTSLGEH